MTSPITICGMEAMQRDFRENWEDRVEPDNVHKTLEAISDSIDAAGSLLHSTYNSIAAESAIAALENIAEMLSGPHISVIPNGSDVTVNFPLDSGFSCFADISLVQAIANTSDHEDDPVAYRSDVAARLRQIADTLEITP